MRLDKKAVRALCAGQDLMDIDKVDASSKDIDEVRHCCLPPSPQLCCVCSASPFACTANKRSLVLCSQVTVLKSLPRLLRLDLSGNRLESVTALAAHSALKWLSLAHNGITAIPPLDIPELQVWRHRLNAVLRPVCRAGSQLFHYVGQLSFPLVTLMVSLLGLEHGVQHVLTRQRLLMQVLNIAGNKISGRLSIHGVPKLRALIANDNAITAVKGAQLAAPP